MVDIVNTNNTLDLSYLTDNINLYKNNASSIQQVILDHLANSTNGLVNIPDPTNPFVYLLEVSSVCTSAAVLETNLALNKIYPSLAQTNDDLYRHMSDKDFIGIFAQPSTAIFTFVIQLNSLINNILPVPNGNYKLATIPRNTIFTVLGYTFSMQYPINILYYPNTNNFLIEYDGSQISPVLPLASYIIPSVIFTDSNGIQWLKFNVDTLQTNITSYNPPVISAQAFSFDILFADQYYFTRVFYKLTNSSKIWTEMYTTHTDQVYDPTIPTAVLKVIDNNLNVYIPEIYVNNNQVAGQIRIDVYTTKGQITLNLTDTPLTNFNTQLTAIDTINDINDYTNVLHNTSFIGYCSDVIAGGSNGLSFNEVRTRVINNTLGNFNLPITNNQLDGHGTYNNFEIIKNVDIVTNRIFLAVKDLPLPSNPKLITAANITIETFITDLDQLKLLPEIYINDNRVTIPSNTIFNNTNGKLNIISKNIVNDIINSSIANIIHTTNNNLYLYNPFHYILDGSNTVFELRAYYLDNPKANYTNFINHNNTINLQVSTQSFNIIKIDNGYKITVITNSDNFYQSLSDNNVSAQLSFIPTDNNISVAIKGILRPYKTDKKERIFDFIINTNYDLDSEHNLIIDNFVLNNDTDIILSKSTLTNNLTLIYTTNSVTTDFIKSNSDTKVKSFLLQEGSIAITEEILNITYGIALDNLWTESRSPPDGLKYQTYTTDVIKVYESDIYETSATTGSIFDIKDNTMYYKKLHAKGDPILDDNNLPIYIHRIGDPILDNNGRPTIVDQLKSTRHIDLLLVDGLYYFANESNYVNYKLEIADTLNTYITRDILPMQDILLEQTNMYYYPKKALGNVTVDIGNNIQVNIPSAQEFTVDIYVDNTTYNNSTLLNQLSIETIKTVNRILSSNTTINISDIIIALNNTYGSIINTVSINGLGDGNNYQSVTLVNKQEKLSLKKKLLALENNSLIVTEAININFIKTLSN